MSQTNSGKPLEEKVRLAGKLLVEHHRGFADRIYDSAAARGTLPERPGDFYLLVQGLPLLVECKSSEVYTSLAQASLKKLIRSHQIAAARLYLRAGGASVFLFHHTHAEEVEFWDGAPVVAAYLNKHQKLAQPRFTVPYSAEGIAQGFLQLL